MPRVERDVLRPRALPRDLDSVSAPGIFEKDHHFEKTAELPNVEAGRHAISIDEYRRPYKVDEVANDRIEEVWFTGVHSDVGGGFEDCRLADISLRWSSRAPSTTACSCAER